MFALKSVFEKLRARRSAKMPIAVGSSADSASGGRAGRVLPRFMRRPVRLAAKLVSDEAETPRYAATIMSGVLLGAAMLYGAALGGHLPAAIDTVAARTGFAIEEIKISGHRNTSEIDIIGELALDGWTPLLGFSAEAARNRIATLPWIETVAVRKSYPSTIEIRIVERKPFAIWQNGANLSLVERSGNVIVSYPGQEFASLPLIVGLGAPETAPEIVAKVSSWPELQRRIKAYIRVADRRWDLRLDNQVTVKLPANGEDQAISDLVALDRREAILSRDVAAIDMRLADRLVFRLTSQAVEARAAAIKEREKKRRREKKI